MIYQTRSRTKPDDKICAIHFEFPWSLLGLSLRNVSKICLGLPREVKLQSEKGYKDVGLRKSQEREREFMILSSMKHSKDWFQLHAGLACNGA